MSSEKHQEANKAFGLLLSEQSFKAGRAARVTAAPHWWVRGFPWGQGRGSGAREGVLSVSVHGALIGFDWVKWRWSSKWAGCVLKCCACGLFYLIICLFIVNKIHKNAIKNININPKMYCLYPKIFSLCHRLTWLSESSLKNTLRSKTKKKLQSQTNGLSDVFHFITNSLFVDSSTNQHDQFSVFRSR